ncbi:MAG: DHH family phosphoesterase [Candidatus Sericytochromatia bacterium]|nr:DHH family phosphoesterase [Candidatus Sericytochromatia bacterium]MEB3221451.1 DHH family phosphoesterase [Candidatus Sericytochromatia bacterium]
MDSVSNVAGLGQVAELLRSHDRFLIVPHIAPDPDAFGSTLALARLLTRLGKQAVVFCDEPVPGNCTFLTRCFPVSRELPPDAREWKLLFLDGGERHRQIETTRDWPTWLNLDHHLDNGRFAEWIYVDTRAAATSLIVAQLQPHLGIDLDPETATCLFTGILFDTRGGFITDRCDAALFAEVARLVAAGARPDEVNRELHEQVGLRDLQVYGEGLAGLRTSLDGKVVYACLTRALLAQAADADQPTELLTQHLPKIRGGEVYVLFKESAKGGVKISLRSKGRVAVNVIAKQFGGGGHLFAAGARHGSDLEAAVAAVIPACEEAVRQQLGLVAPVEAP